MRWIALTVLISFTAYTVRCSLRESIVKSARQILALRWGRQVTIDLYIGLLLFNYIIYLNERSLSAAFGWLVPSLFLGNIVPLVYFVIHYGTLVRQIM